METSPSEKETQTLLKLKRENLLLTVLLEQEIQEEVRIRKNIWIVRFSYYPFCTTICNTYSVRTDFGERAVKSQPR